MDYSHAGKSRPLLQLLFHRYQGGRNTSQDSGFRSRNAIDTSIWLQLQPCSSLCRSEIFLTVCRCWQWDDLSALRICWLTGGNGPSSDGRDGLLCHPGSWLCVSISSSVSQWLSYSLQAVRLLIWPVSTRHRISPHCSMSVYRPFPAASRQDFLFKESNSEHPATHEHLFATIFHGIPVTSRRSVLTRVFSLETGGPVPPHSTEQVSLMFDMNVDIMHNLQRC